MSTTEHPIEQLEKLADEFHHWSSEYKHEGDQGTTRRTIEKHMAELDVRFNNLLEHWVANEPKRKEWYEHLHHNAPRPDDDLVLNPPVFVGQSEVGSVLEIRPNDEGTYDIIIDGVIATRVAKKMTFKKDSPVNLLDQKWREITNTHASALEALRNYCEREEGKGAPPWEWARILFGDGLIDYNFGLTARGQRILLR